MNSNKPLGEFGFRLTPLPLKNAAWLYVLLYVMSSLLWANLPPAAIEDLAVNWGIVLLIALPLGLIVLRMLFSLFENVWFAVAIISMITVVSAVAAIALPVDDAMGMVFRTYPFAALGASLGLSLLACILKRVWNRSTLPYLALHLGLLVSVIGGFVSLLMRVDGFVELRRGESADSLVLRDYVLTVTPPGAPPERAKLPYSAMRRGAFETTAGGLKIKAFYAGTGPSGAEMSILADNGTHSGAATVVYGGRSETLKMGDKEYIVGLGSTAMRLPFAMTLDAIAVEYYPGGALPKKYSADVTLSDRAPSAPVRTDAEALSLGSAGAGGAVKRHIVVNSPVGRKGFAVYLFAIEGPETALFEVVRDPGGNVLFAGGALFLVALAVIFVRRLRASRAKTENE